MTTRFAVRAAAILVVMAAPAAPACAADQYVEYTGQALVHGSDRFAYGEHHFLGYRDGRLAERVVLYTCLDGAPFARKTVEYVQPLAPDFLLEDASSGLREGVQEIGGQRTMFFRDRHGEAERSAPLPALDDLVIDAGFDQFVTAHWKSLLDSGREPMRFLVPSRRDFMNFEVLHVRRETVAGIDAEVFRLKLSSVLGWVGPSIELAYSRGERTLLRYRGLGDLRDASGNNISADISFDPADRRPTSPDAMAAARRIALRRCDAT